MDLYRFCGVDEMMILEKRGDLDQLDLNQVKYIKTGIDIWLSCIIECLHLPNSLIVGKNAKNMMAAIVPTFEVLRAFEVLQPNNLIKIIYKEQVADIWASKFQNCRNVAMHWIVIKLIPVPDII